MTRIFDGLQAVSERCVGFRLDGEELGEMVILFRKRFNLFVTAGELVPKLFGKAGC